MMFTYLLEPNMLWKATAVLGMKDTGLHTGFNGGRDRMKSRIISWALFFNRGGMSPLTWKEESEIYISVFHMQMRSTENSQQPWQSCSVPTPAPDIKPQQSWVEQQSICRAQASKTRYLAAFQFCWCLQNNSNCSSFKQYLGFWSNEIKHQGCNCVYGRSTFPRCKSHISVAEGLGEDCLLFCLVFSRDTKTFRCKTIYKTSQGRVINSLYVQDLKKAMEVSTSYEEGINCKLGISVWISLKITTCQVQSSQSTVPKHAVRDKRSSCVISILLLPPPIAQ